MKSRELALNSIRKNLKPNVRIEANGAMLVAGDSLEILRDIPNNTISLILTDPPYHVTRKKNIYGDTQFEKDNHYLQWIGLFAKEWRRVLRPNGSLFCFCDSSMSARLEILFSENFNILSHVVWTKPNDPGFDGWKGKMKKESLRQWYAHSERIIFAEPAIEGNLYRSPFGKFLQDVRENSGLSGHQLTEMIGAHGKVNHGGSVSNWEAGRNIPSRSQYEKICTAILGTGKVNYMPPYEDVIRVFRVDGSKEFTDIWTFPSVRPYIGKHPAEKPLNMLRHAIEATTYEHDIVLDCFAGSGSTAVAATSLGRKSISIEIEERWLASISNRLSKLEHQNTIEIENARKMPDPTPQVALF